MESTRALLVEALAPYKIDIGAVRPDGSRLLTLHNGAGEILIERLLRPVQLMDKWLLIDVVDGLHRDLRILEGRLSPKVIAALERGQCARQSAVF
ncbi:DUF3509 domain-containing protein [Azotobacter chroococcum]|jgi:hypothetical protein|uniref:DUF3509 domain-containing protein n=1 Tax=Azotobacter chroococcum TaxID=353 RepID=A0A4R1PP39_9GAMM|nr:DUF3509 domain-containing protein [Azotobacter chroococcum]ASL27531.1 hypothetical protein ACG10_15475 [Azotobacter chroococcum]QQE87823.1 DUF3509 domain-containing protein [Azotobacter chroococcum]TBV92592.1 DUF3509 domain-containing protein [Azotobacter chroococcum]TCL33171.1 uncharacterized protein DUF3509 [Azotobacter chroococcum]TKD39839.1 DUF3509 domain-containing protein [Azotobacter chroococcum]